ncbi:hypothetical protein [Actinoplanes sp. URMC 104]|uniref:hypothetical protein n=1 Tax=Actinoplanes sp. URMC 104 TaxID=3423409 RepID=UPI003F1A9CE5
MTDTDIREVLTRAAGDLSPAPDLLDRVRAGGNRRAVRRRTVLGGALAVAAAGAGVPVARHRGGTVPVGRRVRGDLAHDRGLIERFERAVRGRVFWIGATPAGPVAGFTMPAEPGWEQQGFAELVDGRPQPGGNTLVVPAGRMGPAALLAGPDRDVLVVLTGDVPVALSEGFEIDAAGRIDRTFVPLRATDGAVVRRIAAPDRTVPIALRPGNASDPVWLTNIEAVVPASTALNRLPERIEQRLPGAGEPPARTEWWDVTRRDGYLDPYGYHVWTGPTEWHLTGATADGRRLVVQTVALDGRARALWMAGRDDEKPRVNYLGMLDDGLSTDAVDGFGETYPILHARLPHGLGVAVAALNCRLRYRVRGEGTWLPAAGDAAVIPAAASELEVQPRHGRATRVGVP